MSFHLVALLVFVLILASAPLTAGTLRREAVRAAERGEPLPRAAKWWLGVRERGVYVLAAGVGVFLLGLALRGFDREALGRSFILIGPALVAYAIHAHVVSRAILRAVEPPARR